MSEELTILGHAVREPLKRLETFAAPSDVDRITLSTEEVTSLCPITGQPDWYTVRLEYRPRKLCIESKSLKLYFWTFREQGQFCEQFASTVLEDIINACDPSWCRVTVRMAPRGGIGIEAVAERDRGGSQ